MQEDFTPNKPFSCGTFISSLDISLVVHLMRNAQQLVISSAILGKLSGQRRVESEELCLVLGLYYYRLYSENTAGGVIIGEMFPK